MTGINAHFSKFPNPKIQTSKLTKKKTGSVNLLSPTKASRHWRDTMVEGKGK